MISRLPARARVLLAALLPVVGAPAAGAPLAAQECERGRISNVFVDNHSIFDLTEMGEDVSFRWFYGLLNAVHMETNEEFIASELLFEAGDCLDPLLLEESERILRAYPFFASVDVFPVPQPDGSQHVVVDTRDEWTTELDVAVAFDEGIKLEGMELTEENFLGRGMLTEVFFFERRGQRDLGVRFETPRLFGTRWDGRFSAGRTRVGSFYSQQFSFPFVGEVGRTSARQIFRYRESVFPYVLPEGSEFSHILVPFQENAAEITVAGRLGSPGNLTIFGVSLLRESLGFDGFPGDVEGGRRGDFDENIPPGPAVTDAVLGQITEAAIFRVNFLLGQRNIHYIQETDLDNMRGVQDIPVGTDVSLTLGRSVGDLAGGDLAAPEDFYTRLRAFGGWAPGPWIFSTSLNVEGRRVFSDAPSGEGWRDVLGELDAYAYWKPSALEAHTFFGRASATGGWSVVRPYQLTLGGRAAVRGFSEAESPGGRRVVVTAEDRIDLGWPAPRVLDLGVSVFADAGKVWAGDVPFGTTSGWEASIGTGIRLEFPSESRNTIRLDVAVPVTGPEAFTSPIFRMNLWEVVGLLPGFSDEEMIRSRRPAVGPDLLSVDPR